MRCFTDPAMQADFERDGYIVVDLLDASAIERLLAVHAGEPNSDQTGFFASMLLDEKADYRARVDAALKAEIAPRVLQLLDNFRVFHCSFAVKAPHAPASSIGLHQDISFVDEGRHQALNIWCPLVDVGPENGWLFVVKGSHRFNHGLRPPTGLMYPHLQAMLEARYLSYLPLRAGQALLMHPCTFHGSPPNRSDDQRVVAAGVAAPREAPLYYCHQDWQRETGEIEVYAVGDDFYLTHVVGQRPRQGEFLGAFPFEVEPLDENRLAESCAPLVSGRPEPGEHVPAFKLPHQDVDSVAAPRTRE